MLRFTAFHSSEFVRSKGTPLRPGWVFFFLSGVGLGEPRRVLKLFGGHRKLWSGSQILDFSLLGRELASKKCTLGFTLNRNAPKRACRIHRRFLQSSLPLDPDWRFNRGKSVRQEGAARNLKQRSEIISCKEIHDLFMK